MTNIFRRLKLAFGATAVSRVPAAPAARLLPRAVLTPAERVAELEALIADDETDLPRTADRVASLRRRLADAREAMKFWTGGTA